MIKVKGNKAIFTGKDAKLLRKTAKELKMTPQNVFTGMLWEFMMKHAREEALKRDNLRV